MKTDFNTLLEVYNNSKEKEKLIFLDVLNDLIKWVFELKKAKKTPQSIYIEPFFKEITKDLNFQSVQEYKTFMKELKDFIYEWIDIKWRRSWIFNITKERSLLSKEIKSYYQIIWKEELEEIQDTRKLLLNNFIEYWFIEIFVSKNEEYHKICKDFEKTILKINEKNRKVYIWLWNIKDKTTRNFLERIQIDYWVEKINKWFEFIFNDLETVNYLTHKKDLESLKHRIHFKENSSDYDKTTWILYYSKKDIHKFKKTKSINKGHELCKIVFNYPIWTKINFSQINFLYDDNNKRYSWLIDNAAKIKRLIDNLNKIIKEKTKNKKLLLLSQETIDNNHFIIRNF
jgi:hypothetical protein